eukprot:PhM_4_TR328/c0_g1_i2/m.10256/K19932/NCS1; neuronal calcium sensor 1
MGAAPSISNNHSRKLRVSLPSNEEIQQLAMHSHYDEQHVRVLVEQFLSEAPSGSVTLEEFSSTIATLIGVTNPEVSRLLFSVFDRNNNGRVRYDEFVLGMSTMTRGTAEEKISFAFSLLDVRRSGKVSREDVSKIVHALHRSMGELVTHEGEEFSSVQEFVERFFKEAGVGPGFDMTFEQYKAAAMRNPSIVQGLSL